MNVKKSAGSVRSEWRFSRLKLGAAVAMSLAGTLGLRGAVRAAEPDVLLQVPGNALGFVVINNLQSLDNKIKHIETRLQLPVSSDPLSMMETQAGMGSGLDVHGSMAAVFLPMPAGYEQGHPGQPAVVMVMPGSDMKAMFSHEKLSAPVNGVATFTDQQGAINYAAVHGGYTVVAQSKQVLSEYLAETTWGMPIETSPLMLAKLHAADIAAYLDSGAAGKGATVKLESLRHKMDASNRPAQQLVGADLAISLVEDILHQTHSMMIGITIGHGGIAFDGHLSLAANSPLATAFNSGKPVGPKPFAGLPGGDILGAMVYRGDTGALAGILKNAMHEGAAQDPKSNSAAYQAAMHQFESKIASTYQGFTSTSGVALAPEAGGPILRGVELSHVASVTKLQDSFQTSIKNIVAQDNAPGQLAKLGLKFTSAEHANAFDIADGIHVSTTTLNLEPTGATLPAGMQHAQKMILHLEQTLFFGPHGMEVDMAPLGQTLLLGVNVGHKTLAQAAADLAAGNDAISAEPAITKASKHLLPDAADVAYLPIDRWIMVGLDELRQSNGFPAGGPAGAVATPASLSAAAVGDSADIRFYLPEDQLENIVTQAKQVVPLVMMMQMNAQQGGQ